MFVELGQECLITDLNKIKIMKYMGICSDISMKWLFFHCFEIELEFRSDDFCGRRKNGEPGEKPSGQGREPITNSTHIWRWVRESNPGHIQWWEASALTTVPTLRQIIKCTCITFLVHSQYSWELRCSPKKIHITTFGRLFSIVTQPYPHPMKFKFSFILS